jgi:hypothetical protein
MQFSLIALALSASALAAPIARRQDTNAVGDVLDNAVTGLEDGLQGAGSQVEGITDQLVNTNNPDSLISTLSDNSLPNLQDTLDTLVGRRQDTNAVGDVLDNAVTGLQDGLQGAGSQVEGITDQLLDTDNPDSAISTVSGNSLENLKGSLADLGLGGS